MKQTIVLKARVHGDGKQSESFWQLTKQYARACDDVSKFYFKQDMSLSKSKLGKLCYHYIRNHYGLKAQPTQSVFRSVLTRYKSVNALMKERSYTQVSWAFYQLEQFLTYKAHLNYDEVIKINPQYTSQRCPNCGAVLVKSRHHRIHTYICLNCGYMSNDDRIGAMNIRYLGLQKIHGKSKPKIIPNKLEKFKDS